MDKTKSVIPVELIKSKIYLIRGQKVMLSLHLAELYQVETRVLIQAVKKTGKDFQKILCFN